MKASSKYLLMAAASIVQDLDDMSAAAAGMVVQGEKFDSEYFFFTALSCGLHTLLNAIQMKRRQISVRHILQGIRDDLEILYYRFEVWRCQRTIDRCNWVISICQRIERWMGGSEDTRWRD